MLVVAAALQIVALVARSEAWHLTIEAAGGTVARRILLGVAARIAALRRSSPTVSPQVPTLIAARFPIIAVEGALAALASFTLISALGLPWWLPIVGIALIGAGERRHEASRNRLLLHAVGVDASLLDAVAVLIAPVTLGQRSIGPGVGAAAVVLILGSDGVAAAAAAGVLLTVTGTIGGLCFAAWSGADQVWAKLAKARHPG